MVDSVMLPVHAQTSEDEPVLYALGDTGPGGGIIFYITSGGLNGLEAAPVDQSTDTRWGCSSIETGATGAGIGDGATNTLTILGFPCGVASSAAAIASTYAGGGFSDWFLPSQDELNEMYTQLHMNSLGDFSNVNYWSSLEFGQFLARNQNFVNGDQLSFNKDNAYRVRAARGF